MIEKQSGLLLVPGQPALVVGEKVSIECGCHVFCGLRVDNHEVSTMATPCSREHEPLMLRFNDLLNWSLANGGTDRDLADVVQDLLQEAEKE